MVSNNAVTLMMVAQFVLVKWQFNYVAGMWQMKTNYAACVCCMALQCHIITWKSHLHFTIHLIRLAKAYASISWTQ
jgi:hypothetical protein